MASFDKRVRSLSLFVWRAAILLPLMTPEKLLTTVDSFWRSFAGHFTVLRDEFHTTGLYRVSVEASSCQLTHGLF